MLDAVLNRLRRHLTRRDVPIWYDPAYRAPLSSFEGRTGVEPRRADFVVWYLLDAGVIDASDLRTPPRVEYSDLARVHTPEHLESLSNPAVLGRIFGVDPADVPVDEVLLTVRLATGGTIEATRTSLRTKAPAINLLGGFHHAAPNRAAGKSPVNDIAVAVAVARSEGFRGKVGVLDLDAHPADGLSACFKDDPNAWIGSIAGSDWGALDAVDQIVLPARSNDRACLAAINSLICRAPKVDLMYVIAGGDVLDGDKYGLLGMTLAGARQRDLMVARAYEGVPSVWLPGGGYHPDAWKVQAGTALALMFATRRAIPARYDPLGAHFGAIFERLEADRLGDAFDLSSADIEEQLGLSSRPPRLLGLYTKEGIEYALHRYGVLEHLTRLGFTEFRADVDRAAGGDRARIFGRFRPWLGWAPTQERVYEDLLIELVVQVRKIGGVEMLFVDWLTLRNPRRAFASPRPQLPGQEAPGLGIAREMTELLVQMARRRHLSGVAFRPAWYHVAYVARDRFRFLDPEREGRFRAMVRDLGEVPLLDATKAIASGRVRMNGQPYQWEPDDMVIRVDGQDIDEAAVTRTMEGVRFTLV